MNAATLNGAVYNITVRFNARGWREMCWLARKTLLTTFITQPSHAHAHAHALGTSTHTYKLRTYTYTHEIALMHAYTVLGTQ